MVNKIDIETNKAFKNKIVKVKIDIIIQYIFYYLNILLY